MAPTAKTPTLGAIRDDTSYAQELLLQTTGIGRKALMKAKRDGLKFTQVGRRNFINGRDWNAYLATKAGAAS